MSNSVFLKPDENGNWGKVGTDAAGSMSEQLVFQSGATAVSDGTVADVSGYAIVSIDAVISGTATVSFEASIDSTNYFLINCIQPTLASPSFSSTTATTRGVRFNVSGFKLFRARISSYTSGTVNVTGYASTTSAVQLQNISTFGSNDTNAPGALLAGVGAYNLLFDGTNWVRQGSGSAVSIDNYSGARIGANTLWAWNGTNYDRVRTVSAGDAVATGILAQGQYVYDATNTNWNRVVSASATSDGYSGTKTPSTALIAFNGTTFDKVRSVNTGQLRTTLYNSAGSEPVISATLSNSDSLGTTGILLGVANFNLGFNGASFDRVRVGKVYKYIEYLNLANATATTVWTPAAGKKFRLMGVQVGTSSGSNALVHLRDGAAGSGTPFHTIRTGQTDTKDFSFGNGYISSASNNVLEIYNNTGATCSVWVTAWGTEE